MSVCLHCKGFGYLATSERSNCSTCRGSGYQTEDKGKLGLLYSNCLVCGGKGTVFKKEECQECMGTGRDIK